MERAIRAVAVFCGARDGVDPRHAEAAREVGRTLAERGITVVYGGGGTGLMGAVANGALDAGGTVIGVIPEALIGPELAHPDLAELHVVRTMAERKAMMAELADVFVALPGGTGTLEEIVEQWSWAMLGYHAKPCGFLDVLGYWSPMRELVDHMREQGFLSEAGASMIRFESSLDPLLTALEEA
ncbi:TIGR00730 family Rossman fold protein [Amnibacterium endophyticum]|uniref:Cytokinin riboside 5'-monophosphate phosphoribohydrolase n=1 Tax=Amnibacterium endophyticum TaxID=2109337 RepID=A0ABW4LHF6_9MICO